MKFTTLCNLTAILQGHWQFTPLNETHLPSSLDSRQHPWHQCPQTLRGVKATRGKGLESIADHPNKYSCFNHPPRPASFSPRGDCELLDISESLRIIASSASQQNEINNNLFPSNNSYVGNEISPGNDSPNPHKKHILYVGDSLSAQAFIAGQCLIEQNNRMDEIHASLATEFFLRPDIPCDSDCLIRADWRRSRSKDLDNPCAGCPKGHVRPFETYSKHPKYWASQVIPGRTIAVLMGNGAWYNVYKGVLNSTTVFEETMKLISPIIHRIIHQYKIPMFWMTLPPTLNAESKNAAFEWNLFRDKNEIVRKHLEQQGVVMIDSDRLFLERKRQDPGMSPDGFHWCNPGEHGAPAFIDQVLFHLVATTSRRIGP